MNFLSKNNMNLLFRTLKNIMCKHFYFYWKTFICIIIDSKNQFIVLFLIAQSTSFLIWPKGLNFLLFWWKSFILCKICFHRLNVFCENLLVVLSNFSSEDNSILLEKGFHVRLTYQTCDVTNNKAKHRSLTNVENKIEIYL